MATGKRYYWMKLKESFMTSDTIDYFMSQPGGANYVVLYQMLCLKTINTEGRLSRQIGEIIIPFDIEKIRRDCKWFSADTIRVALKLYQSFGLIYEDVDGTLVLADHQNLVGSETDYALQKKNQRKNNPTLPPASVDNAMDNVHTDNRDREKRLDIRNADIDVESVEVDVFTPQAEAEQTPPPPHHPPCPYKKIMELYHDICISYPRIEDIDGERKKAVSARWRKHPDLNVFARLFKLAQQSSFLKGDNGRNWSADFDWMMKATNFPKILERKYEDREKAEAGPGGVFNTLGKMFEEADG